MKLQTIAGLGLLLVSGCSSAEKRFERITPGMSSNEVKEAMDAGPSRFEHVADTNYMTWYWGDDYCVLMKDDKVVAKDSTHQGSTASVAGAGYEETSRAQCLAPGQTAKSGTDRTINIPGIGKVRIPESKLRDPATQ